MPKKLITKSSGTCEKCEKYHEELFDNPLPGHVHGYYVCKDCRNANNSLKNYRLKSGKPLTDPIEHGYKLITKSSGICEKCNKYHDELVDNPLPGHVHGYYVCKDCRNVNNNIKNSRLKRGKPLTDPIENNRIKPNKCTIGFCSTCKSKNVELLKSPFSNNLVCDDCYTKEYYKTEKVKARFRKSHRKNRIKKQIHAFKQIANSMISDGIIDINDL